MCHCCHRGYRAILVIHSTASTARVVLMKGYVGCANCRGNSNRTSIEEKDESISTCDGDNNEVAIFMLNEAGKTDSKTQTLRVGI